ncbi:MAG: hypothetical protein LBH04_02065 [Tannerellaceae bacterium]|jgi:hypothetical protein|nr:hypothetical protein [Tannerellaceae bacterium]
MNKQILFITLCLFIINASCNKNSDNDSKESFSAPPDKVIANAPGTLNYYKEFNQWEVKYDFALQAYDSEEHYIIGGFECESIPFVEGSKVLINSNCFSAESPGRFYCYCRNRVL